MKAYVIRNKEGKYYQSSYYQPNFTDDLFIANKYQSIEETKKILNKSFTLVDSFEPVEITIAEGDLEQQLEVYKEALKFGAKRIEFMAFQMLGKALDYNVEENLLELAKESMK